MSKFDEIKRLQQLVGRRGAIIEREQNPCSPNHALLERIEIERDLIDASGWLLAIASKFQPGDADLLHWMATGEGDLEDMPGIHDEINGLLRRLQKAAKIMEESTQ